MNFFTNLMIATGNLPNINTGANWFTDVVEQIVVIIIIAIVAKFVAKLKIGQIVIAVIIGGFVYYTIRNTETVLGWIEALLNTL
ncbi:TcpD family membrane protein [Oceanobacillus sp. FSL K6-0251]|uniref:TcpD family membrane protein n=1 Tax=Oceanobacillus sp. FSL K6-0251 TaxID=2921602 RepID=UPI0030F65930